MQGPRSYGDEMPDFGRVKQKRTDIQRWKPRLHQLMIYVGTSRTGQGAAKRKNKANNAKRKRNRKKRKTNTTSEQFVVSKWCEWPQGTVGRSYGPGFQDDDF